MQTLGCIAVKPFMRSVCLGSIISTWTIQFWRQFYNSTENEQIYTHKNEFFQGAFLFLVSATAPRSISLVTCKQASVNLKTGYLKLLVSPKLQRWNRFNWFVFGAAPVRKVLCPRSQAQWVGIVQVSFSKQWNTRSTFVPSIQPASEVCPTGADIYQNKSLFPSLREAASTSQGSGPPARGTPPSSTSCASEVGAAHRTWSCPVVGQWSLVRT